MDRCGLPHSDAGPGGFGLSFVVIWRAWARIVELSAVPKVDRCASQLGDTEPAAFNGHSAWWPGKLFIGHVGESMFGACCTSAALQSDKVSAAQLSDKFSSLRCISTSIMVRGMSLFVSQNVHTSSVDCMYGALDVSSNLTGLNPRSLLLIEGQGVKIYYE